MPTARVILIPGECREAAPIREALSRAGWTVTTSPALANVAVVFAHQDHYSLAAINNLRALGAVIPVILVSQSPIISSSNTAGIAAISTADPRELVPLLNSLHQNKAPALLGPPLIGFSRAMRELRDYVGQVSDADCNVLILGETGTGKEVVAEAIHANSPRRYNPFVCLNSAAIPDTLIESELFGHERGAFTGASSAQTGKLVFANHGTVFFDEIGDVNLSIQAKLLRAIESRKVYRLGSNRTIDLDIRIVAATNQDLGVAMEEKRFRRDLYYRLNVVRLDLPPLRERREDIPLLIAHFFDYFNARWSRQLTGLSPSSINVLIDYDWPGNVRELRNVVEALFASLSRTVIGGSGNPPQVMRCVTKASGVADSEREKILKALVSTDWNKSRASEQLRWSRMTLYRKMQRHRLPMDRGKSKSS